MDIYNISCEHASISGRKKVTYKSGIYYYLRLLALWTPTRGALKEDGKPMLKSFHYLLETVSWFTLRLWQPL